MKWTRFSNSFDIIALLIIWNNWNNNCSDDNATEHVEFTRHLIDYINVVVSKVIVFSNIMIYENLVKQCGYLLSFSRSMSTRNKVFESVAIKKKKLRRT